MALACSTSGASGCVVRFWWFIGFIISSSTVSTTCSILWVRFIHFLQFYWSIYSRGADDIFGDFESAQPVAAPASQPQPTQQAASSTTSEPGKKSNADILSLFSQAPQQQQFNQFQQQAPQQQMFGNFSQQQFSPQQQQPPSGSFDMLGLGKLTFDDLFFTCYL